MGSFGVPDLGLFGVGIDKRWNFNGRGGFCGEIFGGGGYIIEVGGVGWKWLKTFSRVDFDGVGCGRAWVSSLPKFFVGNSFQFWKLPPYFCINSRDNVYYPIFLTCYII